MYRNSFLFKIQLHLLVIKTIELIYNEYDKKNET
jgi:hypothetical protein